MPEIDTQIREYIDSTSAPLAVADLLDASVGTVDVTRTRRRPRRQWMVAAAAVAAVLLLAVIPMLLRNETPPADSDPEPVPSTLALPAPLPDDIAYTGATKQEPGVETGPTVEPAGDPVLVDTPFGPIEWTRYYSAPHPANVVDLPGGGYFAWGEELGPGEGWYSVDGAVWQERTQPGFLFNSYQGWPFVDWQLPYDEASGLSLWRHMEDEWREVAIPPHVGSVYGVDSLGPVDLIVGVCDVSPFTSDCSGNPDWIVALDAQGGAMAYDAPWSPPTHDPELGVEWREVSVIARPDGGFVAFLITVVGPGVGVFPAGEEPVTRLGDNPTELWISDDGFTWDHHGEIPFVTPMTIGIDGTTAAGSITVTVSTEHGPASHWVSTDGVDWIQTGQPEDPYADIADVHDVRRDWVEFFGEPPTIVETDIGWLVTQGTHHGYAISQDEGQTWELLPGPPWVAENENRAMESHLVATSDFLFAADSAGEVWIGIIKP